MVPTAQKRPASGAFLAGDHEGRITARPAIVDIGAACLFAHGVQGVVLDRGFGVTEGFHRFTGRERGSEPCRQAGPLRGLGFGHGQRAPPFGHGVGTGRAAKGFVTEGEASDEGSCPQGPPRCMGAKTVLVTGGGRRLGAATVSALVDAGWTALVPRPKVHLGSRSASRQLGRCAWPRRGAGASGRPGHAGRRGNLGSGGAVRCIGVRRRLGRARTQRLDLFPQRRRRGAC